MPHYLRQVVEALLYSNFFISACAFFLTVETYLLTGHDVSYTMACFVFLCTLFTYNVSSVHWLVRRRKTVLLAAEQPWGIRNYKALAVLGIASLAGAMILFFCQGLQVDLVFVAVLALISTGYTVPLFYRRLRSVPLLKVFLIALVWSAVTVLFPLIDAGAEAGTSAVMFIWIRRFLFILALALLFDIRDYTYDRHTRTLTFPGLIGTGYTRFLSLALLGLYLVLVLYTEQGAMLMGLAGATVVAGLIVWNASEEKPRIYYALLADGAMLVHFAFVYLATR